MRAQLGYTFNNEVLSDRKFKMLYYAYLIKNFKRKDIITTR
jgi:hypothetical protein